MTTPSYFTVAADGLQSIDRHFADFLQRQAGANGSDELWVAAALLSYATTTLKHVCLELAHIDEVVARLTDDPKNVPSIPDLRPALIGASAVVEAAPDDLTYNPLVLDGDRLYLLRYWRYEQQLTQLIRGRISNPPFDTTPYIGQIAKVSKLFNDPTSGTQPDWQQVAVLAALRNPFTIITGGPGTGKTTVVAAILALMLEQSADLRTAIVAPTGKAQARVKEAILSELKNLQCSDETKRALTELPTSTIHRLLGVKLNSPYFRHDARNRLECDVLVIDEASMVDQPLMTKLLQAIPDHARVIMLGDKDQLASVEQGAVLGDLCASTPVLNQFDPAFVKEAAGHGFTVPATSPADLPIVELRVSHRFDETSDIGKLKGAINSTARGRSLPASPWQILTSAPTESLTHAPLPQKGALAQSLARFLKKRGIDNVLNAPDPGTALAAFDQFRILCALRRGPYGVENINRLVRNMLGLQQDFAKGLPIMITSNNHQLKLYNGDIGICWPGDDDKIRVWFPAGETAPPVLTPASGGPSSHLSQPRDFLPSQLPAHEPVFAMTVHKSQGSGFDNILFILPDRDSPVLTNELVYTAITRAKERVNVWSGQEVFEGAVNRRTIRHSGLEI